MELWNQVNLMPPPTFTFKAEKKDLDLMKLRNALQDAIGHFKDQGFLSRETALLSRITYRMKMKFRSAKDFKSLEKVSHALNRYFKCNIYPYLKLVLSLIPKDYHKNAYLPTKNMMVYILVKLQGLAKLMERIHDSCKIAAFLTNKRMSIGHFWKLSVIVFALLSRIYVLVKYNCQYICDLYAKLFAHANHLHNPGADWLPKEYELPSDLREWLGLQWVYEEEYVDLTNETLPQILDFFDLCDDDEDVEFCDEYVLVDEEAELNDFRKLKEKKLGKFGLYSVKTTPNKAEKREKLKALRESQKQARKEKKQAMRGFSTDIDCGEIITIDESFTDNIDNKIMDDNYDNENENLQPTDNLELGEILPKQSYKSVIEINDSVEAKTNLTKENREENNTNLHTDIISIQEGIDILEDLVNSSNKTLENCETLSETMTNNFLGDRTQNNSPSIDVLSGSEISVDHKSNLLKDRTKNKILFDNKEQSMHGDNDISPSIVVLSESEVSSPEIIELSNVEFENKVTIPKKTKKKANKSAVNVSNKDKSSKKVKKVVYESKNISLCKSKNKKRSLSEDDLDISEIKHVKKKNKTIHNLVTSTPISKNSQAKENLLNVFNVTKTNKDKLPKKKKLKNANATNEILEQERRNHKEPNSTIINKSSKKKSINSSTSISLSNLSSIIEISTNKTSESIKNKKGKNKNKLDKSKEKSRLENDYISRGSKIKKKNKIKHNSVENISLNNTFGKMGGIKRKGHLADKSKNSKKKKT